MGVRWNIALFVASRPPFPTFCGMPEEKENKRETPFW